MSSVLREKDPGLRTVLRTAAVGFRCRFGPLVSMLDASPAFLVLRLVSFARRLVLLAVLFVSAVPVAPLPLGPGVLSSLSGGFVFAESGAWRVLGGPSALVLPLFFRSSLRPVFAVCVLC